MKTLVAMGLCVTASLLTGSAQADTFYIYTGNDFTSCNTGPSPCGSITATLDLPAPLGDNLPFTTLIGGAPGGGEITISDNGITLTEDFLDIDRNGGDVAVSTDANGNISTWYINIFLPIIGSPTLTTAKCSPPAGICSGTQDSFQTFTGVTDSNSDDPGRWVTTPEPSAIILTVTLIGLLMIIQHRENWNRSAWLRGAGLRPPNPRCLLGEICGWICAGAQRSWMRGSPDVTAGIRISRSSDYSNSPQTVGFD